VWAGTLSPTHVLILTSQLQRSPRSRIFADRGGTPDLQGWDASTVIAARQHNLIASLVNALSNSKNPDLFISYPGAPAEEQTTAQPTTLAELTGGMVDNFIYG
jgi:hypothetical protein